MQGGAAAFFCSVRPVEQGARSAFVIERGAGGVEGLQACQHRRGGEGLVDRLQHGREAAIRAREGQLAEGHVGVARALAKSLARGGEASEVGTLKTVDGLFLVAHDKQRALFAFRFRQRGKVGGRVGGRVGGGVAGRVREDFLRQLFDDAPLGVVGVLRFVDENMVEAAV